MRNTIGIVLAAAAFVGSLSASIQTVQAKEVQGKVTRVMVLDDGDARVYGPGDAECGESDYIPIDSVEHADVIDQWVRIAISAALSGRDFRVWYSDSTCKITNASIETP